MSKFGYLIAVSALFGGLAINHVAGNPKVLHDTVSVRFCPETANKTEEYTPQETIEAQKALNRRFCKNRYIINKEYFEERSALDNLPDVDVTPWRQANTRLTYWLLATPLLCAIGYAAIWASHANAIDNRYKVLERYKLEVKKFSAPLRVQRARTDHREVLVQEDNTLEDEIAFQSRRVQNGWVNPEKEKTEAEIRERQIALSLGEMDAQIAKFDTEIQKQKNEKAKLVRLLNKTISSPTATETEIKQASVGLSSPKVKQQLKEALKAYEGGWLLEVLTNKKPLILIGEMGSGKTWFAVSIALARKILLDAPIEFVMDRHMQGDNDEVWSLLDAKRKAKDESELPGMFKASRKHWLDRIKQGKKNLETPTQTIVDEFTNLRDLKDPETMKEEAELWFNMALSDPRKALDFVLIMTHKDTNAAWGHNNADTRNNNTILIERYSKDGEVPLPNVTIKRGLRDNNGKMRIDIDQKIPKWFNPHDLYTWLTEEIVPKSLEEDYEDEPEQANEDE